MRSFDIFDTVLIRKCGTAENLFRLLSRRIYGDDDFQSSALFSWRCHAEALAKEKYGHEPSLSEIYDVFDTRSFSDVSPADVMNVELQLEKENLIPNTLIRKLVVKDEDYIFISDMYLSSAFLTDILYSFGLLHDFSDKSRVFVSCEYNATKASGKLYDVVRQSLNISTWLHYGDNVWSDNKMAKEKGITAVKVNSGYSKEEKYYLEKTEGLYDCDKYKILIDIQRSVRLELSDNCRMAFAADCIAPVYIGYVCNILATARKQGIKTLYFLSRDSYILYKIAQKYRADYPEIALKYLFVSRKSLMHPCIYDGTAEEICEMMGLETFKGERVKRIANYLQLGEHAFDRLGFEKIKTEGDLDAFRALLNEYCGEIQQSARADRKVLLEYFVQEGLLARGKKALVDVGWLGTSRFLINKLLAKEGCDEVETFYLMNFNRVLPPSKGKYCSYLGECDFRSPVVPIIETLFSASPYRSTLSYEQKGGRVYPIFNASTRPTKSEIIRSNLFAVLKTVDYIKQSGIDLFGVMPTWSKIAVSCITHPDKIDMTALTGLEDQDELGKDKEMVAKLSLNELLAYIFSKGDNEFKSYSVYLTNKHIAPFAVSLHNGYNTLLKKMIKIIKKYAK